MNQLCTIVVGMVYRLTTCINNDFNISIKNPTDLVCIPLGTHLISTHFLYVFCNNSFGIKLAWS